MRMTVAVFLYRVAEYIFTLHRTRDNNNVKYSKEITQYWDNGSY